MTAAGRRVALPVACTLACTLALVVACDGGGPGAPTPPPPAVSVVSVDTLRPGQPAFVRGSGLTALRSLLIDGVEATELVVRSDSVAEFRMPSLRACETDTRAVKVSANGGAAIGAVVRVAPSISLRPAETRVLTADDLKCLRLPGAAGDYVLSAANLALPATEVEVQRALLSVRVLGTGDVGTSAPASTVASFASRGGVTPVEPAIPEQGALAVSRSLAPVPFDANYATAAVGDTLHFVDWFSGQPGICHQPTATVANFRAKVVALSGNVAVVVDLRHPLAAAYLDPAKLGWLRDAVAMTDRLLLPTMRSVFDPDYAPPAGGGGRFYVLLGFMPGALQGATGFAYDGPLPTVNIASQATCPRASEMVVSTVSAERLAMPSYQNVSQTAGLFLHEYAHSADALTSGRGRIAGIIGEGLATLAQETASRIASLQPLGARHASVGSDAPAVSDGALGMWGTGAAFGPWQSNGRYGANARMLLFLRELTGEASVDHGRRPTLYQRLLAAPVDWANRQATVAHIITTLGIDYAELTDRHAIASITAGLIDPGIAHDLPRYTSWDHAERARAVGPLSAGFPGRVSRRADGSRTLEAPDGGHAALYLMADGRRGVSLELVSMTPTSRAVRLTRLR